MIKQGKSKKRVTDHGEVFTAEREVNAMLDLIKQETERIDSRFLEPACRDDNFLAEILRRKLVDFEDSNVIFPGVDVAGGVCYFLWERDNKGLFEISNKYKGTDIVSERKLDEFEILIRQSQAVSILRKVLSKNKKKKLKLQRKSLMINEFLPQRPESHPMIYAYTFSNPQYKGLLKVGYTEKDVERRVGQHIVLEALPGIPTKQPDGLSRQA